jgi:hypothetical protein
MGPVPAFSALLAAVGLLSQDPGASGEEFTRLHAGVMKAEPWAAVPWKGNLLEARAAAAREGKPVFIWAMDGKPLGSV